MRQKNFREYFFIPYALAIGNHVAENLKMIEYFFRREFYAFFNVLVWEKSTYVMKIFLQRK